MVTDGLGLSQLYDMGTMVYSDYKLLTSGNNKAIMERVGDAGGELTEIAGFGLLLKKFGSTKGTDRTISTVTDKWSFGELLPESALNKIQRSLLESLRNSGDTAVVRKKSVSMNDLRQLTNVT